MSNLIKFADAIELLKDVIENSSVKNQKHIELSRVNANERIKYQEALMVIQSAISRGETSQNEVNERLGL